MSNLVFKYLVLPIILILLAGGIFWWLDLPAWNSLQAAQEVIAKNTAVLKERQQLSENLKKLISQYQERISDVAKINLIVGSDPSIPELLTMFEGLASANSLAFNSVDFNILKPVIGQAAAQIKNLPPAGVQIIQVTARVKGSYQNFLNYLKSVESNIRLMDTQIAAFSIAQTAGAGTASINFNNIEFQLVVNAYYQ